MTTTHLSTLHNDTGRSLRRLMLLARAGVIGFLLIVAVLHVVSQAFDPISRFVSEYVLGDYPWLMRLAFLSVAIACLATTLLAHRGLPPSWGRTSVTLLLALSTVGTLVAGMVDTDPKDVLATAPTTFGLVHYGAFMGSVLAFLVAMAVMWRIFARTPGLQQHARPQLLFSAALLATFLLMFFSSTEVVGATQRAFLLVVMTWLVVASGWLSQVHEAALHHDDAEAVATSTPSTAPGHG